MGFYSRPHHQANGIDHSKYDCISHSVSGTATTTAMQACVTATGCSTSTGHCGFQWAQVRECPAAVMGECDHHGACVTAPVSCPPRCNGGNAMCIEMCVARCECPPEKPIMLNS